PPCAALSYSRGAHPHLPSLPTRRSSDLTSKNVRNAVTTTEGPAGVSKCQDSVRPPETAINPKKTANTSICSGVLASRRAVAAGIDRKSTRLNSSHVKISYAVLCLKKKTN